MDSALLNFIENLQNISSYGEDFHELSDFKTFLVSIEEYVDDYENISFISLLRRKILDIISNYSLNDLLGMSKESIVERMRENELIEPATNLILDEIKSALSEITTKDFLNHLEEGREHKKQKSSGSYLSFNFNFDDLPDTPPLFTIIMELQQSPYNYITLNKLLEIDSSEILDHCQWPMLLQLLRKSMVMNRINFCQLGWNEIEYEKMKLKSLEVHAYWILNLSVSQATDVAFNVLSYLLTYSGIIPDNHHPEPLPPLPPPLPLATSTTSANCSDIHGCSGSMPLVDFGLVRSVLNSPLPLAHGRLLEILLLSMTSLLAQSKADKSTDKLIAMIFLLLARGTWPDASSSSGESNNENDSSNKPYNELPPVHLASSSSSSSSVPLLDLLACITTRHTSALPSESPEGCNDRVSKNGQCTVNAWLRQGGLFPASLHSHALHSGLLFTLYERLQATSGIILTWTPTYVDSVSMYHADCIPNNNLAFIYYCWCFDIRLWISIISSICDDVNLLVRSIPLAYMDKMNGNIATTIESNDGTTSRRGDMSTSVLWNGDLEVHSNFNGYSMNEEKDVIMIPKLIPDLDSNKLFWNLTVDVQEGEVVAKSGVSSTNTSAAVTMTASDAKSDSSIMIGGVDKVQSFLLQLVKSISVLIQLTTMSQSSDKESNGPKNNNNQVFHFIDSQYDLIDITKGLLSICSTSNNLRAIWPEALSIISDVILQKAIHLDPYPFTTTTTTTTSTITTQEINVYYLFTLLDQIQFEDTDSRIDNPKYSIVMTVWHQILSHSIRCIQENSQQITSIIAINSLIGSCVSSINRFLRYFSSSTSLDKMIVLPVTSLLHILLDSVEQSPTKESPNTQTLLSFLLEVSQHHLQRITLLQFDRNNESDDAFISGKSSQSPPRSLPQSSLFERIGKFLFGALCDAAVRVGSSSSSNESGEGIDIGSIHPITTALLEFLSDGFTLEVNNRMEWLYNSPESQRYRDLLSHQITLPSVWEVISLSKMTTSSLLLWLLGLPEGLVFMGRLDVALKVLGNSLQPFHHQKLDNVKDVIVYSEITVVCWSIYDTDTCADNDELVTPISDTHNGSSYNENNDSESLTSIQSKVTWYPFSLLLLRILRPLFWSLKSCLQIKLEFDKLFSQSTVNSSIEKEKVMTVENDSMNIMDNSYDNITWYQMIANKSIHTLGTFSEKRIPLLFPVDDIELDVNISKLTIVPASQCSYTTQSILVEYSTPPSSDDIFLLTLLPTLSIASIRKYFQQRLSLIVTLDNEESTIPRTTESESESGLIADLSRNESQDMMSEHFLLLEMITEYSIQCNYLNTLESNSYKAIVLQTLASINKSITEHFDNLCATSNGKCNLQLLVLVSIAVLLASPSSLTDSLLADPLKGTVASIRSWYSTPSMLSQDLEGDVIRLLQKYRSGEAVHIWQLSGCSLRESIRLILQQWFVNWLKLEDVIIITCCCLDQGIQQAIYACAALMWSFGQKMRYSNSFVSGAGYENLERALLDYDVSLSSMKVTLEELHKLN